MCYDKNPNNRTKIAKGWFVWGFVLMMTTAVWAADVEQGQVGADTNESLYAADVDVGGRVAGASTSKPIQSIKFEEDFGVRKALAMLGSMYQRNIVPTPNVDGQLAFRSLTNVTFEEAMDAILGENFKYEQDGKLIKVYTKDEYKKLKEDPERMVYKVFTLYYITAAEAKKLITPVLSASTNARIETTTAAVTDFPTGDSISSVTGGGDAAAMHDTIIVYDYPENVDEVGRVLSLIDVRPKQVLVEATVLSARLTEEIATGIDWNSLYGVTINSMVSIGTGVQEGLSQSGFASTVQTTTSSGGFSAGITNDHVAVLVRALEEVTDVTILANPKILAVNKQLGQVYIGKKIGYRSQTTQTQTSTTEQVQFLDTGTKLSFRPYIGDDGYIRMDIHPKDSSGELKVDLPEETSAELVSNIIVKDGQTIVIGGLFRDVVNTTRYQIPILGDLPIVGVLFRGKSDKNERQEVIVMLTPHVIEEPKETDGDARGDDISRKRTGAKDELQWIGRGKLAEEHYAKAAKYYFEDNNESAMEELNAALKLRPSYLEAIRLKERIIADVEGQEALQNLERQMLGNIDRQDAPKWLRRRASSEN